MAEALARPPRPRPVGAHGAARAAEAIAELL
jgi:hypothetical protein